MASKKVYKLQPGTWTQGTPDTGGLDVLRAFVGNGDEQTLAVLSGSRACPAFPHHLAATHVRAGDDRIVRLGQWFANLDATAQMTPVVLAATVALVAMGRSLDILALGDDNATVLGLKVRRTRIGAVLLTVALTAAAVTVAGLVAFVGLVAPHLARSLVGGRNARVIPVAAALGAILVSAADTLGRKVIAPAQIPADLVIALVGTPYFIFVLWRTRET